MLMSYVYEKREEWEDLMKSLKKCKKNLKSTKKKKDNIVLHTTTMSYYIKNYFQFTMWKKYPNRPSK